MSNQEPAAYLFPAPVDLEVFAQAQAAALAADIDRTGRLALRAAADGDLRTAINLFREASAIALAALAATKGMVE